MHTSIHTYGHACIQVCRKAYEMAYMHTYESAYAHACTQHIWIHAARITNMNRCLNSFKYEYTSAHKHICIHACRCTCTHPSLHPCTLAWLRINTCAHNTSAYLLRLKSIHLNRVDAQMHTWVSAHMHISKWCKQTCYLQNYLHLQDCMQAHMYICIPA